MPTILDKEQEMEAVPQLWSLESASNYLGVNAGVLRQAIKKGELESFTLGEQYYVTNDSVVAFLEQRKNKPCVTGRKPKNEKK